MKYKTLLFDLDGTIVDTNESIISSFLHTLEKFYPGKYKREDLVPHMGKTLYEQLAIFGTEEEVEEMAKTYREHNYLYHDEMVKEFPYVKEVLQQLKSLGATLGVVTTKRRETALMGIKLMGAEDLMSTLVAYEDTKLHKPNPDPVLLAMDQLNADPATTLMVGDSQYDLQAAQKAGITSIGVAWSVKGPEFLKQFDPNYILDDMRELIPIIEGKE